MASNQSERERPAQNGFAVRDLRVKALLSPDDLAKLVGLSTPHLRNIENELRSASPAHLDRIAQAVGCRIESLCRDTEGRLTAQNGFAIRDLRVKARLSAEELAQRVGISTPHLRNIENEHRSASALDLERIAAAIDCRVQSLRREPLSLRQAVSA